MKFLTNEWFDAVTENIYRLFNKSSKLTFTFCEVFENCPGENETVWVVYDIDHGIAKGVTHGVGSVPEADYRAFGSYENHIKICKKELDPKKAVIAGTFRIEDNQEITPLKVLSLLGMYMRLVEAKQIDHVDYE